MTEEEKRALLICSEAEGDTPCSECPLYGHCKFDGLNSNAVVIDEPYAIRDRNLHEEIADLLSIFERTIEDFCKAIKAIRAIEDFCKAVKAFADFASNSLEEIEKTLTVFYTPSTRRPPAVFRRPKIKTIKPRTKPRYVDKLYKIIPALFCPYDGGLFRHAKTTTKEAQIV